MGAEEQTLENAANTVLNILTTGNPNRILRPNSRVLLVEDHDPVKQLSQRFTAAIAEAISRYQRDSGEKPNVITTSYPVQRPMGSDNPVPQKILDELKTAHVAIGTYGNPGAEIQEAEKAFLHEQYVMPILQRAQQDDFGVFAVAARPTWSVLESLADTKAIEKVRNLSLAVKNYLEANTGERMRVYSGQSCLSMTVPKEHPIIADCFSVCETSMINIPGGETFFAPVHATVDGEITMLPGSYYNLRDAVQGELRLGVEQGRIYDLMNRTGVDAEIEARLEGDFETDANRYIGEMAIGTFEGALQIPMEDLQYNMTTLEKVFGWHFAYGSSVHVGGDHKANVHVDNSFRYGDIYVGDDQLVKDGQLNEQLLQEYMPDAA